MIRVALVAAFAMGALACQAPQADPPVAPFEQFRQAFTSGADCTRLFELRNAAKASGSESQAEEMNDKLRSVRCFSSTSKRSPDTVRDGTFTVQEYRIYLAIITAPMSLPVEQVYAETAKKFGVSPLVARQTAERLSNVISDNSWSATPAAEIRHASDWNGETP